MNYGFENVLHEMKIHGAAIWGAGARGNRLFDILQSHGIVVKHIIDKEAMKSCGSMMSVNLCDIGKGNDCVCIISPLLPKEELEKIASDVSEYFPICIDMSRFERLLYSEPIIDECMNYSAAKPFNHYESPFSNRAEYEISAKTPVTPPKNVDLNVDMQVAFMKIIGEYAQDFHRRYDNNVFRYRHNGMFEDGDAMVYHAMIRHYKPKHIIEIGSGYSTAVALDTFTFWNCDVQMTCIEPYPDRLYSVMKKGDALTLNIIEDIVQNVPIKEFERLEKNDILFIDSSHVLKNGGDVVMEFLQIIPCLKPGVIIHIHDICYPFRYPLTWIADGRPYTEAFLLHAFLMDNSNYEILFWEDYIGRYHKQAYENLRGPVPDVGSSFWMRKKEAH